MRMTINFQSNICNLISWIRIYRDPTLGGVIREGVDTMNMTAVNILPYYHVMRSGCAVCEHVALS